MNRKVLLSFEWKAAPQGTFRARIAAFNEVDRYKDVTFPGAFPEGKEIVIGAYEHQTPLAGFLPTGRGVVTQDAEAAYVDGEFFLDTPQGEATYRTVKRMGTLQEWSYGYNVLEASFDEAVLKAFPGALRGLIKVDPFEVSPVLKGAGMDTGTESIKDGGLVAEGVRLLAEVEAFRGRAIDRAAFRAKAGRRLSTATRDHLTGLMTALTEAAAGLRTLLDEVDGDSGKSAVPADLQSIYAAHVAREAEQMRQLMKEIESHGGTGNQA